MSRYRLARTLRPSTSGSTSRPFESRERACALPAVVTRLAVGLTETTLRRFVRACIKLIMGMIRHLIQVANEMERALSYRCPSPGTTKKEAKQKSTQRKRNQLGEASGKPKHLRSVRSRRSLPPPFAPGFLAPDLEMLDERARALDSLACGRRAAMRRPREEHQRRYAVRGHSPNLPLFDAACAEAIVERSLGRYLRQHPCRSTRSRVRPMTSNRKR
jgi:hypothetical protein